MPAILWKRRDGAGLERCVLDIEPGGLRLSGTTLLVVDGRPHEIRYSVLTDAAGATTTVGAHVQGHDGDRRLALASDGAGTWSVGDDPILELFGATDVHLGWTPATATLPIRRLRLDVGESAQVTAAIISFPEHEVERRIQTYERVDHQIYQMSGTGDGMVTLTVDADGLVVEHSGGWSAVASS